MQVKDALLTGELAEGTVIAGEKGISRDVASIEVMEVPEVGSWVTPGILMMTAFYSVKEEPAKQVRIVQTLIEKQAAGIVLKLGRFVETIPNEMLELANEYAFPIITLPKHIPYINVLTPLFERLYQEKQTAEKKARHPFAKLLKGDTSTLTNAIEMVSNMVHSPVYIEDSEGSLLYTSEDFHADGWRKSISLFSKPDYPSYAQMLERWRMEFLEKSHSTFKIQGFPDRLVLPLHTRGKMFAIVHILYKDEQIVNNISIAHMKQVGYKLSELFMSEQLYLQKKRLDDMKQLEREINNLNNFDHNTQVSVLHFHASWVDIPYYSSFYLIDHSCLIHKMITDLLYELTNSKIIVFEKYHNFYAFISYANQHYSEHLSQVHTIMDHHNSSHQIDHLKVSISSGIKTKESFEKSIQFVTKIMETGCKVRPEENIYTHDQLGIYEILLKLTADPFVQDYTNMILSSLHQDLLKTLQVYLNENGNVSKTAEKLFVHRRTLTYRLQKIQELLGRDLNDANNRFVLQFCLLIKELV